MCRFSTFSLVPRCHCGTGHVTLCSTDCLEHVDTASFKKKVFGHGVQLVSKGELEPRGTGEKAARSWKMTRRSQSSLGILASLEPGIESVKLKWNSVETIQSW